MSISLTNMTIVRSLYQCLRGQELKQISPIFLCRRLNCVSLSNHPYQPNALTKVQHCNYNQTFKSYSNNLQQISVLQRHNLTWKVSSRQSSVLTLSKQCCGRRSQLKRSSFLFSLSAVRTCANVKLSRLSHKMTLFPTCLTLRQSFQLRPPWWILQTSSFSTSVCCANIKEFSNVRMQPPWRVLFFGSDRFSLPALKALHENMLQTESEFKVVENLEVVCTASMTPVKKYSKEMGLCIHEWPIKVEKGMFDVSVLSSFGKMIPGRVINAFPYGIINIHPSLLPRWRGATPIPHTILSGDTLTGITLMKLRAKHFDTGPVLLQKSLPVPEGSTTLQLCDLLAVHGVKLMLAALCDLPSLERQEIEQPSDGITYAPKISKGMEVVDWENSTMCEIDRQYRAIHELMPLTSSYSGYRVKLYDMVPVNTIPDEVIEPLVRRLYNVSSSAAIPPGRTYHLKQQHCILIKCKDGWVGFHRLFVNTMLTAAAFYNGYLSRPGSVNNYFESHSSTLKIDTDNSVPTAVHN
ncbi:methionyl-tRNA formyltransferase, mitochondrial-like [Ylistrum balloti]|uniref:methionyl-tRNA formyltransferase, mitochondrial-like n=1 Tax=Ylistrum balloti TaxID=509963 RepID=UPI002905F367|nr:methionyl-tRNA formyltransferase, mitochondrial-like [Ylistrum balloti]